METPQVELPHYRCHKVVRAAKIVDIDFGQRLDLAPYGVEEVGADWIANRKASVGGYFVRYDDGYTSFSPAKVFEDGYTPEPTDAAPPSVPRGLPPLSGFDVQDLIAAEYFFTTADATKHAPQMDGLGMLTFCVLVLRGGFTVTGESHCANTAWFDAELGRKLAREAAGDKVFELLAFQRTLARM